MNKLRMAVVGAGHLGRIHARLLAAMAEVELVGIADPAAAARDQAAQDCNTRGFADHRELFEKVDGAVIAAPTHLHHAVGLDFLRRGLHVLVEKPMAATRTEADELVEAAERHGAILQVGHVERFNPALTAAGPYLEGARFIEGVRAGSFTFRSTDVGVVLDLMIHDLDVVLAVVRSKVRSVSALGLAMLGQHEDLVHARLEFENGCVAQLKASRVSAATQREMQFWTDEGFCAVDFAGLKASVVRPSELILRRELDVEKLSDEDKTHLQQHLMSDHLRHEQLDVRPANALADEQRDFVTSIRAASTPRVDGRQGRDAMAVAEQILDAIASHRWHGTADGPIGPHARPPLPILRGPHWNRHFDPAIRHREAG